MPSDQREQGAAIGRGPRAAPGQISQGPLRRHAAAARAGGGDRAQAARALLDEPFGVLDPGTGTHIHELVRPLWREHGMTVLMVTHDLKEGFGAIITYDLDLTRDSAVPGLGLSKSPEERGNEMQNKEAAI